MRTGIVFNIDPEIEGNEILEYIKSGVQVVAVKCIKNKNKRNRGFETQRFKFYFIGKFTYLRECSFILFLARSILQNLIQFIMVIRTYLRCKSNIRCNQYKIECNRDFFLIMCSMSKESSNG